MKVQAHIILIALLSAMLSGCTHDFSTLVRQQEKLDVVFYDGGHPAATGTISQNSLAYKMVVNWLNSNKDGWTNSLPTYVPEVLLRGREFQLNLRSKDVIFGYGREQYIRPITAADYSKIKGEIESEIKTK